MALLGSLVAWHSASSVGEVPGFAGPPGELARLSLGSALQVAATAGDRGPELALAARNASSTPCARLPRRRRGGPGRVSMIARFMPGRNDSRGIQGMTGEGPAPGPGRAGPRGAHADLAASASASVGGGADIPSPAGYTDACEKLALLRR